LVSSIAYLYFYGRVTREKDLSLSTPSLQS
jgi:hypothetical protein